MNRFLRINLLFMIVCCTLFAQSTTTFFKFTSNTGVTHNIVIPNNVTPMVKVNSNPNTALTPISVGDEIGAFFKNSSGQYVCVGAIKWENKGATQIIAWGDNQQVGKVVGFPLSDGPIIYFKIYVAKAKYEYFAEATYMPIIGFDTPHIFHTNGVSVLSSLKMINQGTNPTNPTNPNNPTNPSIDVNELTIPDVYTLSQNYPNPFNPTTKISYSLPKLSYVTLTVYDLNGKEITRLLDNRVSNIGTNYVEWNGKNAKGNLASSGVYFYKIEARSTETGKTEFLQVKSMILMK